MALRIVFADPTAGAQYKAAMTRTLQGIARASSRASRASAKLIQERGRADIRKAGQFGARWENGLTVTSEPANGNFINNRIEMGHDQKGARNFEFGGTVKGRPLLWVPLSFSDAKGKTAKTFGAPLFLVERDGKPPLLLSAADRKPKFVGLRSVTIPQKWHLRDIMNKTMRDDFPKLYNENLTV